MRHGSLFSGIGGFDLAAEWMGWQNVFHCEWMPFPRQILKHYWPNAISYHDITQTDFTIHRGCIDILTGGFPCQPYSLAGKRLGKNDERHLWPHMLRAVQEIRPTYVVGENVRGIFNWSGGLVFEEVCADLEGCGYEVQPILLAAASVGAPHRRERCWFVATDSMSLRLQHGEESGEVGRRQAEVQGQGGQPSDATQADGEVSYASDTDSFRQFIVSRDNEVNASEGWQYAQHDAESVGIKRWWEEFPTQPPLCGGDDGLPTELDGITFSRWRKESIMGYGNAIVPQVAYKIFKTINDLHDDTSNNISMLRSSSNNNRNKKQK